MSIQLSQKEQKIFKTLLKVVMEKTPNTTLRVCGGFVRDKLLGLESNDIDIAVDNMTGEDFASLISTKVSVIEANPEQSKHLATAMIRIDDQSIDFVNLRTETYSNSRIPQMKFGSPEEDALRRDLTINSIFFNINTNCIEDFVGGMKDLENHIIRTPLNPIQTFLDDPLRILRCIRCATRFNFKVQEDIIKAAKLPEIQKALKEKVSNERIWTELSGKKDGDEYKPGILNGNYPMVGISLLKEMGLIELLFDPSQEEMTNLEYNDAMVPWETNQNSIYHEFNIWDHTFKVCEKLTSTNSLRSDIDPETSLILNLTALLHDIGKRYKGIQSINSIGKTSYKKHEEVSAKIAQVILQRLKAPNNIIIRVFTLIDNHLRPHKLMAEGTPRAIRKFVKDFTDWNYSIDIAIADNLGKKYFLPEEEIAEIQLYENLRKKIIELMPTKDSTKLPRPINGKDLIAMGFDPGPIMGKILSMIDDLLLDNPDLTKEQAIEIVKNMK